jgi:hypothetical protein
MWMAQYKKKLETGFTELAWKVHPPPNTPVIPPLTLPLMVTTIPVRT